MPSERVQQQIDRLLTEAETALADSDWDLARRRSEGVLSLDPANEDGKAYLEAAQRGVTRSQQAYVLSAPEPSIAPAAHAAAHPASFASGRYIVKKFLGEGGKKKVYLAHDTTLDRDVAFAIIKTEGLDDAARTRVIREAQVMGRLGDHPNLMPIHDLGREGDQPFMVLPIMPGGDVEGLIETAQDHRLPLDRVKEIAIAVCRGLEFAHSHGIIHRDLKPGNVWLTGDGTPKIGDFGLALPMERTRLTQVGMMVGTVAYMPPEQALGGDITPKADLYSLGCMLYEMLTGRPPFLGDDHVAVIGQHINTPPVAPTWHRQDCPKPLEALVMRVLAKDPGQRPDSARDVLAALEALDLGQAPPIAPAGTPEATEGRSLESLAGGVFVGRQKETGELRAALEEALSGHGKMVMLVGEPGIGKTRTALELTTYAGLRRCQVLWGRCYESQGAPPYWPWVQAIRGYVRLREPDQLRQEMGSGAAEIAEIVSDVRQRLPDLKPPPQLDSPEQARFRLFDSVTAFLKTASTGQPIVLVLDDLHWSDKPSLLLLEFIARELTGARLLLLGTYRDIELSRQHPLAETLGDLNREHLFDRILLRGLTEEDVGKFIEMTSGIKPPPELVRAVHTQTEGNPLFVTEVVRLLVQEGHLTRERLEASAAEQGGEIGRVRGRGGTTTWTVRIPEGVREVIGRRLNRLSARCNETLTVAAALGREFTLQQLGAVVENVTEDMLLQVLEEALAARVIEEIATAVGRYQFTHALIQETLTNELSLTRRVRLHGRIAEALERLYGREAEAHAAELAFHFAGAEAVLGTEKLVRYSRVAGERALAAFAHEDALSYFDRALTALSGAAIDDDIAALRHGAGLALAALRQVDRSLEHFRAAFDYYLKSSQIDDALEVAEYQFVAYEGALAMLALQERVLEIASEESLRKGYVLTAWARGVGALRGDFATASSAIERALKIARSHGDKHLEMRAYAAASWIAMWHRRVQDVIENATLALALANEVNDPLLLSGVHRDLMYYFGPLGEESEFQHHFEAAAAAARRAGDRERLSTIHWWAGADAALRGDWPNARRLCDLSLSYWAEHFRPILTKMLVTVQTGTEDANLFRILGQILAQAPRYLIGVRLSLAEAAWVAPVDARLIEVLKGAPDALRDSAPLSIATAHMVKAWDVIRNKGSGEAATKAHRDLAPFEDWSMLSFFPPSWLLASLGALMGDAKLVDQHMAQGVEDATRAGYRAVLGWCKFQWAELLHEFGDPGDRDRVSKLWDESLAIARELGMKPLVERVIARKKILGA